MTDSQDSVKDSVPGWRERVVPQTATLEDGDPVAVGEFRIVGRIGEGAQAVVYLGVNADGETAAVKVLRPERRSDDRSMDAFGNELRALRMAPDSMSPRFYCAGWTAARPYLVSEYLKGPSLEQMIQRNGPLARPALSLFATGVSTVVASLHERRIEHGDIKPRHVIIGTGSRVFLIDFGIAGFGDGRLRRRDVFNLAAVILYAAGGRLPYEGTPLEISSRTMAGQADVSALPRNWRGTFQKCLDPNQRRCPSAAHVFRVVSG